MTTAPGRVPNNPRPRAPALPRRGLCDRSSGADRGQHGWRSRGTTVASSATVIVRTCPLFAAAPPINDEQRRCSGYPYRLLGRQRINDNAPERTLVIRDCRVIGYSFGDLAELTQQCGDTVDRFGLALEAADLRSPLTFVAVYAYFQWSKSLIYPEALPLSPRWGLVVFQVPRRSSSESGTRMAPAMRIALILPSDIAL